MASVQTAVSDMPVTVKSREVQRGMLVEMSKRRKDAYQHFLAAAHLELVLTSDYEHAGDAELARRSRISAASCFWRAGEPDRAKEIFDALIGNAPDLASEIHEIIQELEESTRHCG